MVEMTTSKASASETGAPKTAIMPLAAVAATKVAIEIGDSILDFDKSRANVLYSGTQTLTVQDNPRALIVRTGFNTAKGQLIKARFHTFLCFFRFSITYETFTSDSVPIEAKC